MRADRSYFARRFAAQEARRAGTLRADDHRYARGEVVDTDTDPRVAPQATLLDLRRLAFVLPMPPSVNALYGHAANGAKFLLPEQRQFRSAVIGIVRAAMRGDQEREELLVGRIEMRVTLYFANRRRTDTSNRIKALEDALTHAGAYHDDSQIDRHVVERVIRAGVEECAVMLREIAA